MATAQQMPSDMLLRFATEIATEIELRGLGRCTSDCSRSGVDQLPLDDPGKLCGPRHWTCDRGHEWWGAENGALLSTPWPRDVEHVDELPAATWTHPRRLLVALTISWAVLVLVLYGIAMQIKR